MEIKIYGNLDHAGFEQELLTQYPALAGQKIKIFQNENGHTVCRIKTEVVTEEEVKTILLRHLQTPPPKEENKMAETKLPVPEEGEWLDLIGGGFRKLDAQLKARLAQVDAMAEAAKKQIAQAVAAVEPQAEKLVQNFLVKGEAFLAGAEERRRNEVALLEKKISIESAERQKEITKAVVGQAKVLELALKTDNERLNKLEHQRDVILAKLQEAQKEVKEEG